MDKLRQAIKINERVVHVMEHILKKEHWKHSLLLKSIATELGDYQYKLQQLVARAKKMLDKEERKKQALSLKPDSLLVYISLYQSNGDDLKQWQQLLLSLVNTSVGRPIYLKESHVRKFVTTRTNLINEAYAIIAVPKTAILTLSDDQKMTDSFGHERLALRTNAIQLSNIVRFIHANRYHYTWEDGRLVH